VVLVNLLEVLTGHKVARRDRDFKHDLVREIEVPFSLAVRPSIQPDAAPPYAVTLTLARSLARARTCASRWTSSSRT
jgi:hypothetical protein